MKTIFFSLCFIFLFSCNVTDPPTGACKWGTNRQNCTITTAEDCANLPNGSFREGADCP